MEKMYQESKKAPEWVDETRIRSSSITDFLQNYFSHTDQSVVRYDTISDLHFSGSNSEVVEKIKRGSATISNIQVLYDHDKSEQVHAVFDSEGRGHNIDVYLKGRALEDYLAFFELQR